MEFIQAVKDRATGTCIFCEKPNSADERAFILKRGAHAFAILNSFPYNPGHLMVAPYRHVTDFSLTDDEALGLHRLTRDMVSLLRSALRPDGFNIGVNMGAVSGAGFEHLHVHVVPRWHGDTNFMPVLGETKVLPEALAKTYQKLRDAMKDSI